MRDPSPLAGAAGTVTVVDAPGAVPTLLRRELRSSLLGAAVAAAATAAAGDTAAEVPKKRLTSVWTRVPSACPRTSSAQGADAAVNFLMQPFLNLGIDAKSSLCGRRRHPEF